MKTMSEFFDYKTAEAMGDVLYYSFQSSKCKLSELALRGFVQLALPIEAALKDEEPPYELA